MKLFKKFSIYNTQLTEKKNRRKKIGIIFLSLAMIIITGVLGIDIILDRRETSMAADNSIGLEVEEHDENQSNTDDKVGQSENQMTEKDITANQGDDGSEYYTVPQNNDKDDEIENKSDEEPLDQDGNADPTGEEADGDERVIDEGESVQGSAQSVQRIYNSVVPPHILLSAKDRGNKKIVYLTFDDGPTPKVTPQVLDILKEEGVKATFFVIGSLAEENRDLIKRAAEEGHVVANHSYSHNYEAIYSSVDSFMDEIERTDNLLRDIIGDEYEGRYVRLPGGGFGSKYDLYKATLLQNGYSYIAWNTVTNDAVERNATAEGLFKNFKDTLNGNDFSVVLMHDGAAQKETPQSLRLIIDYLKREGYEFRTFDE